MKYEDYSKYRGELLFEITDILKEYFELAARKAYQECLVSLSNAKHMAAIELEEEFKDIHNNFEVY